MKVVGHHGESYIFLTGIEIEDAISLGEGVDLTPADTSHIDIHSALAACNSQADIPSIVSFIPLITAQFKINAKNPKQSSILAWNATWDAILLSAILNSEICFNIQSDTNANLINSKSSLRSITHFMHGYPGSKPHKVTPEERIWIIENFDNARNLLGNERFRTAIHCLATYRWHSLPRIKLAVIWSGIESIFGIQSEIRFRLSINIARFLHLNNEENRKSIFDSVKNLYTIRSKAVHGEKLKSDISNIVTESSELLRTIIIKSIEQRSIPDENLLIP